MKKKLRIPKFNWKKLRKAIPLALAGMVLALLLCVALPIGIAASQARPRTFTFETVPPAPVAIVFGAEVLRSGAPSGILSDRVELAVALYQAGKVQKILMSGDNRFIDYNEPGAMKAYAVSLGVPAEDVVLDYAGRRTYDTCYRARHIFNVQQAVLVTQSFHLTRALFTCNNLGIEASGVPADIRAYRRSQMAYWTAREGLAIPLAVWQVWVERPLPVLGNPEPIFPVVVIQ